jgi:hypothetical protein
MRSFDLLLCVSLMLLATFIAGKNIEDIRELHRQDSRLITAYNFPVSPRSIVGYDREGQKIAMLPLGFKRLALFVIHGKQFQGDIDLWNRAARQNHSSEIEFVGVCDDPICVQSLTKDPGQAHFASVLFGDYYAMRTILKADAHGQIIVLDRRTDRMSNIQFPNSDAAFSRMMSILAENL